MTAKSTMKMKRALVICHLLPSRLEADVLQSFGGVAVEPRGRPVVAAPGGEIAPSHPRGGAEAGVPELLEALLGEDELLLRLVEPILLEQRTPQHEPAAADLVEKVLAP